MTADPIDCARCGQPHPRCAGHNKAGQPCGRHPKTGVRVCETRQVAPLPPEDHAYVDPLAEMRMLRPDAEVIVIRGEPS